jgi:SAM-dependent methyltransferase
MRPSMDIFGDAVRDYHKGKKAKPKLIRDDGNVDTDDISGYFRTFREFASWEKKALKLVKGRVLDVGVGPGRVALYLQRKGFKVTGIDCSKAVLEVAKERGVKDCRLMDMRNLSFKPGSFDTVLLFGNNFGLAGSKRKTRKILKDLHRITSKKGRILATSIIPGATIKKHRSYLQWNLERGRDIGLITLVYEYKGEKGKPFDLLLVSPGEMMELCVETGWIAKDFVVGDAKSGEHIAVLEKDVKK